jgi:hypothetical protein
MSQKTESSSLLSEVLKHWKLWIVAIATASLALFLGTQVEGTRFHAVTFALIAGVAVLYAIRNIEGVNQWLMRRGW